MIYLLRSEIRLLRNKFFANVAKYYWTYRCKIRLLILDSSLIGLYIAYDKLCIPAKGRLKNAEDALCWLRGWVGPGEVKAEFDIICQEIHKPAESREKIWRDFSKSTFYMPFLLVTWAFFVGSFGGTITMQTFAVVVFERLNAPIDQYTAAVFLGLAQFVGTLLCVFAIHFTGKRKLNFVSIAGTAFCFCAAAVYGYLNDSNVIIGENYSWLPTTMMIGAAFLSHIGIRLLPWVLAGEVFPVKVILYLILSHL